MRQKKYTGLFDPDSGPEMPEIRLQLPPIKIQPSHHSFRTLPCEIIINMSNLKILIIVTNISTYANGTLETGLWLSELTHLYPEPFQLKRNGKSADVGIE